MSDDEPEYDSLEMDKLVAEMNDTMIAAPVRRKMNATEEHLFRQWHSTRFGWCRPDGAVNIPEPRDCRKRHGENSWLSL